MSTIYIVICCRWHGDKRVSNWKKTATLKRDIEVNKAQGETYHMLCWPKFNRLIYCLTDEISLNNVNLNWSRGLQIF
jgi:hypothetical protein